jgi:hypothetical protein
MEFVKKDDPLLTDDQKKDAKMEARFKILIAAGIAESIPAIITDTTNALRKGKAIVGEASKNSKSKKDKSKSKSVSRERRGWKPSRTQNHLRIATIMIVALVQMTPSISPKTRKRRIRLDQVSLAQSPVLIQTLWIVSQSNLRVIRLPPMT